jgi:hypothetical protein
MAMISPASSTMNFMRRLQCNAPVGATAMVRNLSNLVPAPRVPTNEGRDFRWPGRRSRRHSQRTRRLPCEQRREFRQPVAGYKRLRALHRWRLQSIRRSRLSLCNPARSGELIAHRQSTSSCGSRQSSTLGPPRDGSAAGSGTGMIRKLIYRRRLRINLTPPEVLP